LVDPRAGLHEIVGMIEQVEHLRLKLYRVPIGDAECPGQPEINFVDPRTVKRVVALAGDRAGSDYPRGGVAGGFVDSAVIDGVKKTITGYSLNASFRQ
jgi:hypothetical protein